MSEWKNGGCHCQAVRFKVRSDFKKGLICNCSICQMKGFVHLIVEACDFQLIQGAEMQSDYRFNTGTARHLFCKNCGISSYYIPRSHPDGVDINLRCVEGVNLESMSLEDFNGRAWEANIDSIRGYH